MSDNGTRVVLFTCNWNAHESLQEGGTRRLPFPAGVRPLKVDCLGQVGSGTILKAFEKGADGVMLAGCLPEECHYQFGSRRAAEFFEEVSQILKLLGIGQERFEFCQVGAGEAAALAQKVSLFVERLSAGSESRV
jgi:coenzyme F420-reducing hydrogenase delta subunit